MVGVAYTSQYKKPDGGDTHMGYHVCATAWPTSSEWSPAQPFWDLMNPAFPYMDAGLPCADIAPNGNPDNIGVAAYTQVTGADGLGPITQVFMVNFTPEPGQHVLMQEVQGDQFDDGLYPAISIHYQADPEDPVLASVTFMGQIADTDTLYPRAALVRVDVPGVIWDGWVDNNWNRRITGNYNVSDIPFTNPGVSTAVVSAVPNTYWAAWCDRIEMEPPPNVVWGSFGYAGL